MMKGELKMAEKETKVENLMNDDFELNLEALEAVAGGGQCGSYHSWKVIGKKKARFWGDNLIVECKDCGEKDEMWAQNPVEDFIDWLTE